MKTIKAVVIDDELNNRDLITKLVHKTHVDFHIIGDAENIEEGFDLINRVKPDLVFLDIKMPGGSGFDLLRKFAKPDFEVVFITGFDEYAIQAFEFNALDYVLKPIDAYKLKITLDKVQFRVYNKLSFAENLKQIVELYNINSAAISKIPLHYKDKVILVDVNEIFSIQSDQGCTLFDTLNSNKYTSSKQLSDFEFIIENHPNFIKISKGVFINLNYVKSYTKGQICMITLNNNDVFEVSRRKKTEILGLLGNK